MAQHLTFDLLVPKLAAVKGLTCIAPVACMTSENRPTAVSKEQEIVHRGMHAAFRGIPNRTVGPFVEVLWQLACNAF